VNDGEQYPGKAYRACGPALERLARENLGPLAIGRDGGDECEIEDDRPRLLSGIVDSLVVGEQVGWAMRVGRCAPGRITQLDRGACESRWFSRSFALFRLP
jgi:hypothetical protein